MQKNIIKVILIILAICILARVLNACLGGRESNNIKYYNELCDTYSFLPTLDELGDFEDYEFKYYRDYMIIFNSYSYVLKLSYNEENYNEQKELVSRKYIYQTEEMSSIPDIEGYKEPSFIIDTFNINTLSLKKYDLNYPKELVFVGTSDETREIAYVCFIDQDIDYIDMPFSDFLQKNCKW